jgi:hypothetical protein
MIRFAAAAILFLLQAAPALAGCEPLHALIREYGISYAGFEKKLPLAEAPNWADWPREDYRLMALPKKDHVRDGYNHSVLVNAKLKKAWIYRTGGFAGVHEWYGPVTIDAGDLRQCEMK